MLSIHVWFNAALVCNLQYIGKTKRRLKDRFNKYRRPINPSGSYIQTAVSELSQQCIATLFSHMLLIPIETPCLRKAREAHLIHKAKTIEPLEMIKRDGL